MDWLDLLAVQGILKSLLQHHSSKALLQPRVLGNKLTQKDNADNEVQIALVGPRQSLLQPHSSKASILQLSVFFIVQLSHPYMTIGKTIALTRWTFVGKVMYLYLLICLGWS